MKQLTKAAIIATCLSVPVLHFGSMSLVLVADPKDLHCVTQWQLPLLGTLGPQASEWWDWIYVLSVVSPPVLWIVVAARKLVFGKWCSAMKPGFN
jgi:hypothetical protein